MSVGRVIALAAFLAAGGAGLADAQPIACSGAFKSHQTAELFFGRRIGTTGVVSEGAFRRFVAREVTPRFPDGLTIYEARGQWRDPTTMRIIREPSTVVMIAMAGDAADHGKLSEIVEAYKKRFSQQSVGIILRAACAAF